MHHYPCLLDIQTQSINQSTFFIADLLTNYIYPFSNPIILYSLHMAEPLEITIINPFVTLYNFIICIFRTLSILLIPSKPLSLSIYTALILDLSFFHIFVSLPYIRTGMSNVSCKILTCIFKLQTP